MDRKLSFRDWVVLIALPFSMMFSSFEIAGIGSLIPLIQKSFGTTDSETALLRFRGTHNRLHSTVAFRRFHAKKARFLTHSDTMGCTDRCFDPSSEQYWLYLVLRSLASMDAEVFRILVNVLQAEHFTGKYLTAALTMNIVGESMAFPSYTLLIISQAITMFYSTTLSFWISSMVLQSYDTRPEVFLGMSYPTVSTIVAVTSFVGLLGGGIGVPYLTQSLQSCSLLAIPIVYAACFTLETLSYITEVIMITRSFWIFSISYFIDGIAGSGIMLNNLQLVLSTTPAGQRASALALFRLTTSLGIMPGAQIMAAISDHFQGSSSDPVDRLEALQKTFLYTWFMPVISTVMCLVILRFYLRDLRRAKQIDLRDREESATLLSGKPQLFDD